jgi:hypothetical protein
MCGARRPKEHNEEQRIGKIKGEGRNKDLEELGK